MTPATLLEKVLRGELHLVGEFRGCTEELSFFIDRKTGRSTSRVLMIYVIEGYLQGAFNVIKISRDISCAANGAGAPPAPLEKGKRYAFPILSFNKERGVASAWLGRGEPVLIDEGEAADPPGEGGPAAPNLVFKQTTPQTS